MITMRFLALAVVAATTVPVAGQDQAARNERLFEAARAGDTARINAALDAGAEIDGTSRYDVTALYFAASNGHLDAVKALVARGANINVPDTFYNSRAAEMAITNGHTAVAAFLLESGAEGADGFLAPSIQLNDAAFLKIAAAARTTTRAGLESAIAVAERLKRPEAIEILRAALASKAPEAAPMALDPATLARYVGTYRDQATGLVLTVTARQNALVAQLGLQPATALTPTSDLVFRVSQANATLTFAGAGSAMESVVLVQGPAKATLVRAANPGTAPATAPPPSAAAGPATSPSPTIAAGPRNWPSFRGDGGGGNADGQRAVTEWDIATGRNIKWKTAIPGLANSSPIVWGDRVFVTTAISKAGDQSFRTGLYGDVLPVNDLSEHEWKMYALDKATGRIVWEQTAFAGAPKTKRHPKASQANSTPVTNGSRVVAVFGSIGQLVAWDVTDGRERWRVDLGVLDSGWFLDPGVQWGHSSSPIIHNDAVILQADVQKGSYLGAWDINTGRELWRTARTDEIPSWGTPVVVRGTSGRDEVVTNGTKIRGYDAATGALLWTLGPNSELTVGTPVAGHGLVFITGGYPPVRPIYAVRPGARGDISLPKNAEASDAIAWSNMTEGTYIPSPLVYRGYLITCNSNGIVTAYNAETGQRAFRGRVGAGGAFSASPVAADGRLYIASEDGDVYVVNAAPGLEQVSRMQMGEPIMATPAISDGVILLRTAGHVYGIGP